MFSQRFLPLLFLGLCFADLQAQCSGTDALGNPATAGLSAEYFPGYFADNTAHVPSTASSTNRVEPFLNYVSDNWGAIVPPATGSVSNPDQFTGRYRGSIFVPVDGDYTFYLSSDDASYLWLGNAALDYPLQTFSATINNGGAHGLLTRTATVFLTAGWHNLQILYGENFGGNRLIFEYENLAAGINRQVVPSSVLCTGLQALVVVPPPPAPPGCSCTDPAGNPGQRGIFSEYYANYYADNLNFFNSNSPGLVRLDSALAFNSDFWGNIVPPASGTASNPERFSTRFRGSLYIPTSGTYTFYMTSDDATYFWLGPEAMAANPALAMAFVTDPGLHAPRTVSASRYLVAGLHPFTIYYGENTGLNRMLLEYESVDAGITRALVPTANYCSCQRDYVLPLKLLHFDASWRALGLAQLDWTVERIGGESPAQIQRAGENMDWVTLHQFVPKQAQEHGLFLDNQPLKGWNYYRLVYTDADGREQYSAIKALEYEGERGVPSIYPNPSRQDEMFLTGFGAEEELSLDLYSLSGQLLQQVSLGEGRHWRLNTLAPGMYLVQIRTSSAVYRLKWQRQ